jgi:hypothetical protein
MLYRLWKSLSFNLRVKLGRLVIVVRLEPATVPEPEKEPE